MMLLRIIANTLNRWNRKEYNSKNGCRQPVVFLCFGKNKIQFNFFSMKLIFSSFHCVQIAPCVYWSELRPHKILSFWLGFHVASISMALVDASKRFYFHTMKVVIIDGYLPCWLSFHASKYSCRHSLLDKHRPGNVAAKTPANQCPSLPYQCRSNVASMHRLDHRNK